MPVDWIDAQRLRARNVSRGQREGVGRVYLMVADDSIVEFVHQVVHHPKETESDRIARVELPHALVRRLRFWITSA